MLFTAIKAIIGITIILGGWLLVEVAWRRVFRGIAAGEDVMGSRWGCHQCLCETPCHKSDGAGGDSALCKADQSGG